MISTDKRRGCFGAVLLCFVAAAGVTDGDFAGRDYGVEAALALVGDGAGVGGDETPSTGLATVLVCAHHFFEGSHGTSATPELLRPASAGAAQYRVRQPLQPAT